MSEHYYYNLSGTIRSRKPQETIAWAKKYLSKLGITRVANVTGLDTIGIPTFLSIRPNAKHLSVSQGKGITPELAEASAIMEAIESYHIENTPAPNLIGSFVELAATQNVIDPNLFNHGFFADHNLSKKTISWIEAKNLVTSEKCFLPHGLTCLDSTKVRDSLGVFSASSNGLASGNCYEEAVTHALFEVIERDATAKWVTLNAQAREKTALDLDSINSESLCWLINCFKKADVQLEVWDVTSEIGVPSFYCVAEDQNELRSLGKFSGSGAHISKEIALSRALTEVAQSRLTLISGSRDDVFPDRYYMRVAQNLVVAKHQMQQKENANLSAPKKNYAECIDLTCANSFTEQIEIIVAALVKNGCDQIYVVDHTKPEISVPVVQALVPKLRFRSQI
ncbi:MAG: YcaO-like family protein [Gammaproteobacteria bacterium]|nr:YcaO-like family protein [Gammaproteobacteria bacterium]